VIRKNKFAAILTAALLGIPQGVPVWAAALEISGVPDGMVRLGVGPVVAPLPDINAAEIRLLSEGFAARFVFLEPAPLPKLILARKPEVSAVKTLAILGQSVKSGRMKFRPAAVFDSARAEGNSKDQGSLPDDGALEINDSLPDGQPLNIRLIGFHAGAQRDKASIPNLPIEESHDVVVVGGGLASLTAAWRLRNKNVLLLEDSGSVGGLAAQGKTADGVTYARGSAYYAMPEGKTAEIYKKLGLTAPKKTGIPSPIDSYFYNGRLIKEVWSEEGLKQLPDSFRRFKGDLQSLGSQGFLNFDGPENIPKKARALDKMSAAEFIKPYGPELKVFLDSYAQSAMGAKTDSLSALALLYFYVSELEERHAWPGGTGGAAESVAKNLMKHDPKIIRTGSRVLRVRNIRGGVEVVYEKDGRLHAVKAKHAILGVPLKVAERVIPEMSETRKALIEKIQYADYPVHSLFTSKDLYTESYDTWFGQKSFTDVITGRWVETQGFAAKPQGPGILTIYNPMTPHDPDALSPAGIVARLKKALLELREMIPGLAREKVLRVETTFWPHSIHVVSPGYLTETAKELASSIKRIHFAHNNVGTPNFEAALTRGWRVAGKVLQNLRRRGTKGPGSV
jgi:oxygen-dependent protoporphyrinogen oxidase